MTKKKSEYQRYSELQEMRRNERYARMQGNIGRAEEINRQSYNRRYRLSKKLGLEQTIPLHDVGHLRENEAVKVSRKETRQPRVKFNRTVKSTDKEGVSKKRMISYTFADKDSIATFVDRIKEGKIPIPLKGYELMFDERDEKSWEMETLESIEKGS